MSKSDKNFWTSLVKTYVFLALAFASLAMLESVIPALIVFLVHIFELIRLNINIAETQYP